MSPSRNDPPLDVAKEPNPIRLGLYDAVGSAAIASRIACEHLEDRNDYPRQLGSIIVARLLRRGIFFWRGDKLIDLSRFKDEPEEPHTWVR